ncbi:MAG: phage tail protein [Saprospirales bacterium]|nr:phage tail protein [Saprospirales bacterium]
MAATGDYPLPKFHFQVEMGDGIRMGFTEVSGLNVEVEVIEYREGNSKQYSKSAQPGLRKHEKVTFKRGTFQGDLSFFEAWKKTYFFQEGNKTGSQFRVDAIIKLLDENHQPVVTWILAKAWATKVQSTDLKADANEVAIETLEMVHKGLTIK